MAFNAAASYASGFDSGKYGFKSIKEVIGDDGKALFGSIGLSNQNLAGNLAGKAMEIEGTLEERNLINDVLMATLNETAKQKKNALLTGLMSKPSGGSSGLLSGLTNYNAILGGLPSGGLLKDPMDTVNKWNSANAKSDPFAGLYGSEKTVPMPQSGSQVDLSKVSYDDLLKQLKMRGAA